METVIKIVKPLGEGKGFSETEIRRFKGPIPVEKEMMMWYNDEFYKVSGWFYDFKGENISTQVILIK